MNHLSHRLENTVLNEYDDEEVPRPFHQDDPPVEPDMPVEFPPVEAHELVTPEELKNQLLSQPLNLLKPIFGGTDIIHLYWFKNS